MSITPITTVEEWQATVSTDQMVVVHFMNLWTDPCRAVDTSFTAAIPKYPALKFVSLDTDQEALSSVTKRYIKVVPTVQVFKNGQMLGEIICSPVRLTPSGLDTFLAKYI
jgi:thiol-disulfide isomerase/thioredoxin